MLIETERLVHPDWPAPTHIGALTTTRLGGYSVAPYGLDKNLPGGLNLGTHVGDDPDKVMRNRALLAQTLPNRPLWLNQVHGNDVVVLDAHSQLNQIADAAVTAQPHIVCAVLTADCLPVLFCDRAGRAVGAAHAGWRGLCGGVLEATALAHAGAAACAPCDQLAWLGPAIGWPKFEVGEDVFTAFMTAALASEHQATLNAFYPSANPNKKLCDLYALARIRLRRAGIKHIYGGEYCTFTQAQYFYSYRRDGVTGRMASLIWLKT